MDFKYSFLWISAACSLTLLGCGGPQERGAGGNVEAWLATLGEVRAKPAAYAARCDAGLDAHACLWYGIYLDQEQPEEAAGDSGDIDQLIGHYWQKGCFLGDGEACGRLGDLRLAALEHSDDPDADQVEEGLALLTRGCTDAPQRSGWACEALGDFYYGVYDLSQEVHRGRAGNYYTLGCSLGNGEACGMSATLMLEHTGSQDEILRGYERGCQLDDGYSCESLGFIYSGSSALGVARNLSRAEAYYDRACTLGETTACTGLGQVYAQQGRDTRTREAYERACTQGDELGCSLLAAIHEAAGDDARARELYAQACELGSAEQCLHLAGLYDKAWDESGSEQFRGKACELGDTASCMALGQAAFEQEDTERARAYYALACEAGDAGGCNWLGYIHAEIDRNAPQALQTFDRACELGDAHGCTWLGHVYFQFDKDVARAWQAYARGCQLGDELACQQAHRLSTH